MVQLCSTFKDYVSIYMITISFGEMMTTQSLGLTCV